MPGEGFTRIQGTKFIGPFFAKWGLDSLCVYSITFMSNWKSLDDVSSGHITNL